MITVSTKMQVGEELTVPRPACAVFVVADDAPLDPSSPDRPSC